MSLSLLQAGRVDAGKTRVAATSVAFHPGELTVVIGPNGSGKSSLLKLLSGELPPTAGRVSLDGQDLAHWNRSALARRRAVLPQDVPAHLPYTVGQVVALGRTPHAPETAAVSGKAVHEGLLRVGLEAQLQQPYSRLSGGQRARVQFARCLAQLHGSPVAPVLLLDEPTASLDPRWQHACLQQARDCARAGWCVIAVLHDLNLASAYADRILLLNAGAVVRDGNADAVIADRCLDSVYGLAFERLRIGGRVAVFSGADAA